MKTIPVRQHGSILIEAIVAVLVLAVGTFGIVKLNTVLLTGGGESKTRAEALQIAQTRIEAMMTAGTLGTCQAAGTTSQTTETNAVAGVNATYRVGQTTDNATAERFDAAVFVSWDGSSDPRNAAADKQIILRTVVACNTAGTSGQIGGDASALNSPKIKTPTGVARVGGRTNPSCGSGCTATVAASSGMASDGLKVYKEGNRVELVQEFYDASGTLTSAKTLLTIDDGSDFSSISGRVYVATSNSGQPIVNVRGSDTSDPSDDRLFVLSSDAAYCARVFPADPAVPAGTSGSAKKYEYFEYNCYVSKGWWGNIGIVQVGTAQQSDKICVGDPNVSTSGLFSRKHALSTTRGYRGFRNNGAANSTTLTDYETVGIGYAASTTNGTTTVSSAYAATHIGADRTATHHDFLIATINGQATCESSGVMTRLTTDTNSSNEFTSNEGQFYCMAQCPPLTPSATVQTTVVRGTITRQTVGPDTGALTGVDPADCQTTPTWTEISGSPGSYSYSCTKQWTGFAGSSWDGGINFQSTGTNTICTNNSGSSPTVTPSNLTVASTVNNRLAAGTSANSITFTDVQLGVTDIVINFDVYPASCLTLGTPQVSWSSGTLVWTAISDATSYSIYSCSLTSSNTICVPNVLVTTTGGGTYTPAARSSGEQGRCYGLVATGTINPSAQSAAKCLVKSGNSTVYQ